MIRKWFKDEGGKKVFLEHLDDVRKLLVKLVLSVGIAFIACWFFRVSIMDFLRRPAEWVWQEKYQAQFPKDFDYQRWETSQMWLEKAQGLNENQREYFLNQIKDIDVQLDSRAWPLLKAAHNLPIRERLEYLLNHPNLYKQLRQRAVDLLLVFPQALPEKFASQVQLLGVFKPAEAFILSMKVTLVAALVAASPVIFFFIIQFIMPAMKARERKVFGQMLIWSVGLFLLGTAFSYYFVLPKVLEFFFSWGTGLGVSNDWRIGYYISFTLQLVSIFGLCFELPIVVMILLKLELLSYKKMKSTRNYAILIIFIISAIITPTPDAFTLMVLAVPMCLLYEICIWLAYHQDKKIKNLHSVLQNK